MADASAFLPLRVLPLSLLPLHGVHAAAFAAPVTVSEWPHRRIMHEPAPEEAESSRSYNPCLLRLL
jgi:hypothetical protein